MKPREIKFSKGIQPANYEGKYFPGAVASPAILISAWFVTLKALDNKVALNTHMVNDSLTDWQNERMNKWMDE